jgi:hypothetical protein
MTMCRIEIEMCFVKSKAECDSELTKLNSCGFLCNLCRDRTCLLKPQKMSY